MGTGRVSLGKMQLGQTVIAEQDVVIGAIGPIGPGEEVEKS